MREPSLRLFFALPCPAPLADRLCTWRDELGLPGRPVRRDNLHVTLAFLGSQPAARLPELLDLAARQRVSAFDLTLDRLERWHGGPLVLAPSHPPPALMQLAEALQAALGAAGLVSDARPYRPHLTLMRDASPLQTPVEADFCLRTERFGLYRSDQGRDGVRYHPLGEWRMAAPDGA